MILFKNSILVKSEHQMSDEEQLAFEEHCRASETYKYLRIDMQAQAEKELEEMRPTGEMAEEDFDRFEELHLERFLDDRDRYRTIKVKGYNPEDHVDYSDLTPRKEEMED